MTDLRNNASQKKRKDMNKYREHRESFERVMGKPKINVSVELPKGYEKQRKEFLDLKNEESFLKDVGKALDKVVKKHLKKGSPQKER